MPSQPRDDGYSLLSGEIWAVLRSGAAKYRYKVIASSTCSSDDVYSYALYDLEATCMRVDGYCWTGLTGDPVLTCSSQGQPITDRD